MINESKLIVFCIVLGNFLSEWDLLLIINTLILKASQRYLRLWLCRLFLLFDLLYLLCIDWFGFLLHHLRA
jgi:hypothetical protein